MFGQLDPGVGLGLLLVMAELMATGAADIALVPLMTADDNGIGIALVVLFAEVYPYRSILISIFGFVVNLA